MSDKTYAISFVQICFLDKNFIFEDWQWIRNVWCHVFEFNNIQIHCELLWLEPVVSASSTTSHLLSADFPADKRIKECKQNEWQWKNKIEWEVSANSYQALWVWFGFWGEAHDNIFNMAWCPPQIPFRTLSWACSLIGQERGGETSEHSPSWIIPNHMPLTQRNCFGSVGALSPHPKAPCPLGLL